MNARLTIALGLVLLPLAVAGCGRAGAHCSGNACGAASTPLSANDMPMMFGATPTAFSTATVASTPTFEPPPAAAPTLPTATSPRETTSPIGVTPTRCSTTLITPAGTPMEIIGPGSLDRVVPQPYDWVRDDCTGEQFPVDPVTHEPLPTTQVGA